MAKAKGACINKPGKEAREVTRLLPMKRSTGAVAQILAWLQENNYISEDDSIADKAAAVSQHILSEARRRQQSEVIVDSATPKSTLYRRFCDVIPAANRREVVEQLSTLFTNMLNEYCAGLDPNASQADAGKVVFPEYLKMSRAQVLSKVTAAKIFSDMAAKLRRRAETLERRIQHDAQFEYAEGSENQIKKERQLAQFDAITSVLTKGAWMASLFLVSRDLINTERLKCGDINGETYAKFLDLLEEAELTADPNNFEDVLNAEETTIEHWMKKADTIQANEGLSAQVSRFLSSILSPHTGLLTFPQRYDTRTMHSKLVELRKASKARGSQEFLQAMGDPTRFAQFEKDETFKQFCGSVLAALKINPSDQETTKRDKAMLATLLFRNCNKASLTYTTPNVTSEFENGKTKVKVTLTSSNSVPKYLTQKLQSAVKIFTKQSHEEDTNFSCIYTPEGVINKQGVSSLKSLIESIFSALNEDKAKPESERRMTPDVFLSHINTILGRTLLAQVAQVDKEAIANDEEQFRQFLRVVYGYATAMQAKGNNFSIHNSVGFMMTKTYLETITTTLPCLASAATITLNKVLRFQDSTYACDTNQFSLSTVMEEISNVLNKVDPLTGKLTSEAREELQKLLIRKFLKNPMFASPVLVTKTVEENGETKEIKQADWTQTPRIYHSWLQQLWQVAVGGQYNEEFIKHLTDNTIIRGLGYWGSFIPFDNFNESQNMEFQILHFMEELVRTQGSVAFVPTFVLGDADSVRYIPTTILNTSDGASMKSAFINVLCQEIQCWRQIVAFDEWCASTSDKVAYKSLFKDEHKTQYVFSFFTELNDQITAIRNTKGLSDAEKIAKIKEALDAIEKDMAEMHQDDFFKQYIAPSLESGYQKFEDTLVGKGLAVRTDNVVSLNEKKFPETYMQQLGQHINPNEGITPLRALFLAMKYGEIQHIQFSGLSPIFYEGTLDMQKRWKEMVASGETLDRDAIDLKTGKPVTGTNKDGKPNFTQKVAYFRDIRENTLWNGLKPTLLNKLLDKLGIKSQPGYHEYEKGSSSTDGQSWRSLDSYRQIMIMSGKWYDNPANEEFYNEILELRRKSADGYNIFDKKNKADLQRLLSIQATFQPLKPFFYGTEEIELMNGDSKMDIPVQIKYSEMVLIPELLPKGHKLRMMGEAMAAQKIDLLASDKCTKVGAWGQATLDFGDSLVRKADESDDAFLARKQNALNTSLTHGVGCHHHTLGFDGYIVQTNVPYHANTPRGEGTQVRKILGYTGLMSSVDEATGETIIRTLASSVARQGFTHIQLTEDDDPIVIQVAEESTNEKGETVLKPVNISGEQMQQLFTAMETSNWIRQTKRFVNKVTNKAKITKMIEQCITNDSRSSDNLLLGLDIDKNGERVVPLTEGIFANDIMAKILSVFRRDAVKQNTEGGTAVQISPLGQDLDMIFDDDCYERDAEGNFVYDENGKRVVREDADPQNCLYTEAAGTFDFSYTDFNGNVKNLEYLDYVNPATGRLLMVDEKTGEVRDCRQGEEDKSKLCQEFPGIIDIVAYRVPTERAYSTINARMVKFFPRCMGGILAVSEAYTTIAGFDFDIDKLYILRHAFVEWREDHFSDSEKESIWNWIYAKYQNEIKAPLENAKTASKIAYLQSVGLHGRTAAKIGESFEDKPLNQYWNEAFADVPEMANKKDEYFAEAVRALYGKTHEHQGRFVTYDANRPFTEQDDAFYNNMKVDYFWDRLQSHDTLVERYSPGGFYNLRADVKAMKRISRNDLDDINDCDDLFESEYEEPNDDPSNMVTINHYQTANTIYGQLIGKAAVQNINQKLISMCTKCELKEPIRFGSMLERAKDHDAVGRDFIMRIKDGETDSELLLAELLSSAVDAVKEAVLEFFGITPATFGMAACAIRMGANYRDIGLLFNQPVVKEALRIIEQDPRTGFNQALEEALQAMGYDQLSSIEQKQARTLSLDSETLYRGIKEYAGGYRTNSVGCVNLYVYKQQDILFAQAAVVQTIQQLNAAATTLSKIVTGSRQDSANSVGSKDASIEYGVRSARALVESLQEESCPIDFQLNEAGTELYSEKDLFDENGNLVQEVYRQMVESAFGIPQMLLHSFKEFLKASKDEFLSQHEVFLAAKDIASKLTAAKVAPEKMLEFINEDFPIFLLNRMGSTTLSQTSPEFDPDYLIPIREETEGGPTDSFVTAKDFFRFYYAGVLEKLFEKYPEARNYLIFDKDFLEVKIGKKGVRYIQFPNIGGLGGTAKSAIMDSWTAAMQDPNPDIARAAEYLVFYNHHTRGTAAFGTNVCNSVMPIEVKQAIEGYLDSFRKMKNLTISGDGIYYNDTLIGSMDDFIKLVLINRASGMYQYTATIRTVDGINRLRKLSTRNGDDGMAAYFATDNEERAGDLVLGIDENSPIVKDHKPAKDVENGTTLYVAPILQIKNNGITRTYVLKGGYTVIGNKYLATVEENSPTLEEGGPQIATATVTYQLVALNDKSNRLSTNTTDYSNLDPVAELNPNSERIVDLPELVLNPLESTDDSTAGTSEASYSPMEQYARDAMAAHEGEVIVFDLETASQFDLKKQKTAYLADAEIYQIAAHKVVNGQIVDTIEIFLDLERNHIAAEWEDRKTHEIIPNPMVEVYKRATKVSREEGLKKFMEWVGANPVFVGQNIDIADGFDLAVLNQNLLNLGLPTVDSVMKASYDTLKLIRYERPGINTPDQAGTYTLEDLIKFLNIEGQNTHNAADDVAATVGLWNYIAGHVKARLSATAARAALNTQAAKERYEYISNILLNQVFDNSLDDPHNCSVNAMRFLVEQAYLANNQDVYRFLRDRGVIREVKDPITGFSTGHLEYDIDQLHQIAREQNLCD